MTDGQPFGQELLNTLLTQRRHGLTGSATHVTVISGTPAEHAPWPEWVHQPLLEAYRGRGITEPYKHQVDAADHAFHGNNVVLATGTASGKSLAYSLPVLTALAERPRATALYLSPTKALGADQLGHARTITRLVPTLHTAEPHLYDGDTPTDIRPWIRNNSRWVFTNPDMLHVGMMPNHSQWSRFFRGLEFVIIDECHHYRGVFGSNVAWVLRRLRRIAARYGSSPTFILASATTANPAAAAQRLIGAPCHPITVDSAPHGSRTIALWEPGPKSTGGTSADVENRRSAPAEAASLTAALVEEGARTLMFVRSRAGAEYATVAVKNHLSGTELASTVAAYRAGYLADDRRRIEKALSDGTLRAVSSTNALELGVDIAGLDAVVLTGFPGTIASFWQQAGRAGRRGQGALIAFVARDDPLDTYLIHNPDALLGQPVESTITNPHNPHIEAPHVVCAATEIPLTDAEIKQLGIENSVRELSEQDILRHRPLGWFPTPGVSPHQHVTLRGSGAGQVVIVEADSGRLLGTVDSARAPATVHPGAVHLHQGEVFVVMDLDLDDGIALVVAGDPGYTTTARSQSDIHLTHVHRHVQYGATGIGFVDVEVTQHVVSYLRRASSGEVIDTIELTMPTSTLRTKAVMWTMTADRLIQGGVPEANFPGALHAAEHAAIGMLPLFASCDRNDIGGVSTALHPDTALPTVFIYDGHPGGAGIAEHGHDHLTRWLSATREAINSCSCTTGCPSCVHSPKCGNGNSPLHKYGAVRVLDAVLQDVAKGQ
ncbi:DEAD/DEAH box helicase [Hoyosella rhizosphaerae]|uniref:DEAD/DEAH box helicase n=1 Tax=Hoyosella rhizosphaerae TaxID=1755582 RepID=UPI001E4F01F1|nr:DEAD/DEAH box helicase [Hoyosella rhizosphaerae]